jgi:hypothetical protein
MSFADSNERVLLFFLHLRMKLFVVATWVLLSTLLHFLFLL